MPTREQLSEHARVLSDEALVERLRAGGLTELAEEVTRQELAARGMDAESAMRAPPPDSPRAAAAAISSGRRIWRRVVRFPLRAVLGVEPLWAVFVFGGAIALAVWRLVTWGIARMLGLDPSYALPAAYAALAVFALAFAWWGVALWRGSGRGESLVWTILARTAAVACGLMATGGTMGALHVVQEYLAR